MQFLFSLGLLIISYTITALTAKKPTVTTPAPATLNDFKFPQHDEGTPQTVVFGDVWLDDPFICYYGNLSNTAIRTSSGGGKK